MVSLCHRRCRTRERALGYVAAYAALKDLVPCHDDDV